MNRRRKKKYESTYVVQLKIGLIIVAIALVVMGIKELLTYLGWI